MWWSLLGGLLYGGLQLLKAKKQSKKYDEEIDDRSELLKELIEKKRMIAMKSGLKLSGTVLSDIEKTKQQVKKPIEKLRKEKEELWIRSILGTPISMGKYFGSEYLKKDMFGN